MNYVVYLERLPLASPKVMYIEACESGSMFDQTLPSDINVMALTAANGSTSSYACYYDRARKTYLGDLFR